MEARPLFLGGLIANNATGSATGPAPVQVNKDTLGGKGIIAGAVTIGTGTGPKAYLEPSVTTKGATLTIQSLLTFKKDGNLTNRVNTSNRTTDRVVANGIVIERGARYMLNTAANKHLPIGLVLVVMSNTSASPINGSFANFPEGATIISGSNTYQASYVGGDGNDMTLTVVPSFLSEAKEAFQCGKGLGAPIRRRARCTIGAQRPLPHWHLSCHQRLACLKRERFYWHWGPSAVDLPMSKQVLSAVAGFLGLCISLSAQEMRDFGSIQTAKGEDGFFWDADQRLE